MTTEVGTKVAARPRRFEVFELKRIPDESGTLYAAEVAQHAGKQFERVFFISNVPRGARRGGHAHRVQDEYLICVRGSVDVRIESLGEVTTIELKRPDVALYLPASYWRDLLNFSPDAVLIVLALRAWSESDYIRDRSAFRRRGAELE